MIPLAIDWRQIIRDIGIVIGVVAGLVTCYGVGATVANPYPAVVAETPSVSYPNYLFRVTFLGAIVLAVIFGGTYVLYQLVQSLRERWTKPSEEFLDKEGDIDG